MSETRHSRASLEQARAEFRASGLVALPGVPARVVASWQRSASNGVRPDQVASEYFTELDTTSRLVRCARPVILHLSEEIRDVAACVALADNRARILSRTGTSATFSGVLDRVSFAEGFGYAEGQVGTNGVGTVLEFGESIQIVGAQHFVESLSAFACAGAPVRDPLTGRIEGVLDISCPSEQSTPLMHSLVRSAAREIERRLLLDRDLLQQALFDAYSRLDGRSRDAVVAVGLRVVMTNPSMQTLLIASDLEALQEHLRYLMTGGRPIAEEVGLPSGIRVAVRGTPVIVGGDVAGMVATVHETHEPPAPTEAPRSQGALAAGSPAGAGSPTRRTSASPAWQLAEETVGVALRGGFPIAVLGEQASGRFTLLADAFTGVHPTGRVVEHAPDEIAEAPDSIARTLLLRHGPAPVLHVLRDVDRVPAAVAQRIVDAVGRTGAALAMTSSTATHTPLLALTRESVTVPPLRNRGADIERLARSTLERVAAGREIRLSKDAVRLIVRFRWPGNLAQLHDAVAAAVEVRPVGTIQAADLPAFCQSAAGVSLRAVDEVERDAIVAALRASEGNRVAAARLLGLARSTLYRKIHQYGITV